MQKFIIVLTNLSAKFASVKRMLLKFILFFTLPVAEIFGGDVLADEFYKYRVDFVFIPSVNLEMAVTQAEDFGDGDVLKLEFRTDTMKLFSRFFTVHNLYTSYYDPHDYSILKSEKTIEQSDVKQEVVASYSDSQVVYLDGDVIRIPPNTHNIFTLLMKCRKVGIDELPKTRFSVDIEGRIYEASCKHRGEEIVRMGNSGVIADEIEIDLFPLNSDASPVVKKTDVFNYGIGRDDSKRFIWIERKAPRRIVKAQFYLSRLWVTAHLVE